MAFAQKLKMLGPGLLFAGAAVGVSHLVQSTKAGASYGFGLLWIVLIVHLLKYPFFEFGPRYASSTGENLLQGYKKLGKGYLHLMTFMTIGSMFAIQSAVTIVTAGLGMYIFNLPGNVFIWSMILLIISGTLLKWGQYNLLDKMIKIIIITLSISTVIAVIFAIGKNPTPLSFVPSLPLDNFASITFLIAFMGWMPAPFDLSIWHSIWTVEKQADTKEDFNTNLALYDFNIGYIFTAILAIGFLSLGALIMYGSGEVFSPKAGTFAKQLIDMYTTSLGSWAKWIISIAAFTTMFSTTLTCFDALPKTMSKVSNLYDTPSKRDYQSIWMLILFIGVGLILGLYISNMGVMIKIATVLSFITAPVFAFANYKLVTSKHTPLSAHPSKSLKFLAQIGLLFLTGFAIFYLYHLLF